MSHARAVRGQNLSDATEHDMNTLQLVPKEEKRLAAAGAPMTLRPGLLRFRLFGDRLE
jgi:hypothetical protein